MTKSEMDRIVQEQLAVDLNCVPSDLDGEKDQLVFVEARENPGRRPFRRGKQYFEMLTMGRSIVVSATPARLHYAREQLAGKARDDAFAMPFIRGHALYSLPDIGRMKHLPPPLSFAYKMVEKNEMPRLRENERFPEALQYDASYPIQNTLAFVARQGERVVGIAGAFAWSPKIWSIGIDVLPEFRGNGLAAYLVSELTFEILAREIVPVYATASSNIASQRVGFRAGYMPAWVSDSRVSFEGELRNS